MTKAIHPEATHHLPFFITPPGETDILMNVMIVFLALIVFLIGILYLRLHALPEHMAHRTEKIQYEIVAVLALISLFTHNHLYWILGLLPGLCGAGRQRAMEPARSKSSVQISGQARNSA